MAQLDEQTLAQVGGADAVWLEIVHRIERFFYCPWREVCSQVEENVVGDALRRAAQVAV